MFMIKAAQEATKKVQQGAETMASYVPGFKQLIEYQNMEGRVANLSETVKLMSGCGAEPLMAAAESHADDERALRFDAYEAGERKRRRAEPVEPVEPVAKRTRSAGARK